jgi:hypothetical protein
MPFKDQQQKQEWERRHRLQRVARRRQLRRVEAARQLTPSAPTDLASSLDFPWHVLAGGGALALVNSRLALGAGGLILVIAALQKKNWQWWATGTAIVAVALFLLLSDQGGGVVNTIAAKK